PHRPAVAKPRVLDEQRDPRVPATEGREHLQFLGELHPQLAAADDRIYPLDRDRVLGAHDARRVVVERGRELLHAGALDLEPRRRAVPPISQQLLPTGAQAGKQIETLDAAPRTLAVFI